LRDVALLLACAVPLLVLFRLISTGLYSTPETDDFCFSYHYAVDGLFGTVALFYKTAIGRILPMVIMTLPAMLSRAIPLDMFIVYPLMMAAVLLAFIAVCMWVCNRLWPAIPGLLLLFLSLTFAATIAVNAVSFREMFLWLPGVACYLVPAALVLVVLTDLTASALAGAPLSTRQTAVLGILCFLAATCNEFTPMWIMAVFGILFAARGFTEFRRHAILGLCPRGLPHSPRRARQSGPDFAVPGRRKGMGLGRRRSRPFHHGLAGSAGTECACMARDRRRHIHFRDLAEAGAGASRRRSGDRHSRPVPAVRLHHMVHCLLRHRRAARAAGAERARGLHHCRLDDIRREHCAICRTVPAEPPDSYTGGRDRPRRAALSASA